jgi:hypothetical protein
MEEPRAREAIRDERRRLANGTNSTRVSSVDIEFRTTR